MSEAFGIILCVEHKSSTATSSTCIFEKIGELTRCGESIRHGDLTRRGELTRRVESTRGGRVKSAQRVKSPRGDLTRCADLTRPPRVDSTRRVNSPRRVKSPCRIDSPQRVNSPIFSKMHVELVAVLDLCSTHKMIPKASDKTCESPSLHALKLQTAQSRKLVKSLV